MRVNPAAMIAIIGRNCYFNVGDTAAHSAAWRVAVPVRGPGERRIYSRRLNGFPSASIAQASSRAFVHKLLRRRKVNATIASGNECNSSFKLTHVFLLSCHFFPVLCERSCFRRVSEAKSDRGCRRQPACGEGAGGTATDLNLSSGGSSSGPAP